MDHAGMDHADMAGPGGRARSRCCHAQGGRRLRWLFAFLLAALLFGAGGSLARAASPAQTSPVPATPPTAAGGPLVTPDTKPAVPGQATGATVPANVTNVTNNNVTLPQMPSVQDFAGGIFTQVLTLLLTGLANALQALIGQAIGSGGPAGGGFITSTPPASTYASPAVADLWGKVRLAADASLALIVAYSGVLIALGKVQRSPYDEALALLPRIGIGLALVNGSLWLGQEAILLNNALCASIGAALPTFGQVAGQSPTLADVLARLAYLITGLLLILQMLMRLALVDVALVLAPAGIVLYLLPGTRSWGEKWSGIFVAAVFTQFVQVLALKLGETLIGGSGGTGLLDFFTGIAVLVLVLKIPALLSGDAGRHLTAAMVTAGAVRGGAASAWKAVHGGDQQRQRQRQPEPEDEA